MTQTDSLRVFKAPDVVISATRTPLNSEDAPEKIDRMNISQLRDLGLTSAKSILSLASGVFIKDYGPAQLTTISIRGTAAEETLFLFDGIRLNNIQNGLLDIFLVPISDLGSVEISRGGASALYGADAVGGVVSFSTETRNEPYVKLSLGAGSYGMQTVGAEANENIGSATINIVVHQQRARNDYEFYFNDGSQNFPMNRIGADYLKRDQFIKISVPSPSGYTSLVIQNVDADRGTPGAVTGPYFVGHARENDKNTIGVLQNAGIIGAFNYSASVGTIYSYLHYTDPSLSINGSGINDYYKMISLQPGIQFSYKGGRFGAAIGADGEVDRAESSEMNGIKNRTRFGLYASGSLKFNEEQNFETRIFPAVRFDDYSDFGSSVNPKLGINIKPLKSMPVHLQASVGTAFRAPTFNDLYYSGFGNPDLKPERSTDYDAGIVVSTDKSMTRLVEPLNLTADASYYHIETRDGIVWLPKTSTIWLPQNFGKILSQGIEFSVQSNYEEFAALRATYSFGKSLDVSDPSNRSTYDKQLIYIPQEQGSVLAAISPGIFTFSTVVHYAGFRFFTQSNDSFLPAFTTTDVSASARIEIGNILVKPIFTVKNLFNLNYEVIPQYPSPMRTFNLDLSTQFNQPTGETQ